jgi:hypothetical protein
LAKSETIPLVDERERERECVSRSLQADANQVILMKGMITLLEANRGAICRRAGTTAIPAC